MNGLSSIALALAALTGAEAFTAVVPWVGCRSCGFLGGPAPHAAGTKAGNSPRCMRPQMMPTGFKILAQDSSGADDPFSAARTRAQTINYAFIAACVPGIMPYQEAVESFVDTTVACLDAGVSLGALDLTMAQTQSTGNENIDRQLGFTGTEDGRQFAAEEVALRRQWIVFVYAAALCVGSHAPEFSSAGDLAALSYVRNIYNNFWKKGQRDVKSINMEMTFATAESNLAAQSPTEKAMLSQALRFALTAFDRLSS